MKNLYKYLFGIAIFCIISLFNEVNATTVTIGTGTSYQRQPFGMYYGYERSSAIYTSTEIGGTGSITSLGFNVEASQTSSASVVIYLKTTTSSIQTAGTWANMISGATTVYSGTLSFTSTGWKTITLTTPFNYTGDNLMVCIETNYGGTGSTSYPYFRYTSSTSKHEIWYQNTSAPTGNGTVNSYRPNIQITYDNCAVPTTQATNITSSDICASEATISWTRGNGSNCAVFMYQGSTGTAAPINGTTYTANTAFGSGTQIGTSGWYCIYNGGGTSVSVTGLTASTAYRVQVCEYNCATTNTKYNTTSTTNNPNNFSTTSVPCYCDASATTCQEYISRVQLGTIDNSTVCTSGGYTDYTAQSTNMSIGSNYSIVVTNGSGGVSDQCGIWIDWNQDGDFGDPNETVTVLGTPGAGQYTATVAPPASSTLGTTRMRVRITYTGTLDPCGTTNYGEVEDYSINVQAGSCVTPGAPINVTGTATGLTTANLSWAAGSPTGSATITYYWVVGTSPTVDYNSVTTHGYTNGTSATVSTLLCNTTYYLRVYASSSCNGTTSDYTTSATFTTNPCPVIPANDQCSGAIALSCNSSTPGTTTAATSTGDPTATCGTTITAPGVWYKYTSTGANDVTVSLCGSALDTKLSIYSGTCASLSCITGEDDDYTICGDNDPSITFTSVNGTTYYFFVHGTGTATGDFTINVTCSPITLPNCPTLNSPSNGATNIGTAASLNWTAPTTGGAVVSYNVYFGTSSNPPFVANVGTALTYSPTGMTAGTTYYWKVTSVNAAGESSSCTIKRFTTSSITNLTVNNTSYTASYMVEHYLISGCLEDSLVKFTGNSRQIGYFQGGSSTIGYHSGIVLSSGNAKDAEGPNSYTNNGIDYGGDGDATINAISGYDSEDAAVLEFYFKPSSNTVSFRYTFASEEYNEWVGSTYNDAFGFFLTGGPENYNSKNIALIPGTSTPVTINNVNHGHADSGCGPGPGTNPSYFRDNACTVSGSYPYKIECDGLTTVLTATAAVTPCKWYHIKLVVADVSDGIYDSWVFLEANSFSSGSGVAMSVANPTGTKHSYEGCTSSITFTRTDTVDTSAPINVSYSMGGTATSGTDYTPPQNPVTIPIGVNSVTIPLYTTQDASTEGTETIILTVTAGGCPCNPDIIKDTIFLHDFVGVNGNIQEPSQTICQGQSITLHGIVTAGNYYQCTWSTGSTFISHNQTITVTPLSTTTYTFNITDSCGNTINKTVTITVDMPVVAPTSVTSNHNTYCFGAYSTITLTATGGSGSVLTWYSGSCMGTVVGTGNNITIPAPTTTTTYYAAWSNTGCGSSSCASVTVTVNQLPTANAGTDFTIPYGTSDTLNGSASGGSGGSYSYSWSPVDSLVSANVQNPITHNIYSLAVYDLTVTDGNGCTGSDQVIVSLSGGPVQAVIQNANPICYGDSIQLYSNGSGGSGSYTYSWSSDPTGFTSTLQNPFVHPDTTTTYIVTANDGWNNAYDSVMVIVNPLPILYNITFTQNGEYCASDSGVVIGLDGSQLNVQYDLYLSGTSTSLTNVLGTGTVIDFGTHPAGTYIVIATNTITHCVDTMTGSATVIINPLPISYDLSVSGSGEYCETYPGVTITLSGSQLGVNYELYLNGTPTNIIEPGTGSAIQFPNMLAGIYTVVATDTTEATMCKDTMNGVATIIVDSLPLLYDLSAPDNEYCASESGVTLTLSGSQIGVNYALYQSGSSTAIMIISGTGGPINFDNQTAGTYIVVATYTSTITHCVDTMGGTVTVIVNPNPTPYNIIPTSAQYCADTNGVAISLSGSQVGVSYQLMLGSNNVGAAVNGTGSQIPLGIHTAGVYTVLATNTTTNCFAYMTGSSTITIYPSPTAYTVTTTPSGTTQYCSGTSGVIIGLSDSDPGITYYLYNNNTYTGNSVSGTGSAISFGPQQTGNYTVVAVNNTTTCDNDMNGSADITLYNNPTAFAGDDTHICFDSSAQLSGSGGEQYLWSPSSSLNYDNIYNPIATPTSTTTYTLTVSDIHGCTDVDEVIVTVVNIPVLTSLTSDLVTDFGYVGDNIIFTANPGSYSSYEFYVDYHGNQEQNGTSNIYETNTLTGTQTIYVIADDNGCKSAIDSLIIQIKPIPNAFTPDGDGINDLFAKGLDLTIINRWGQSLFEGKDGWDGKHDGKLVAPGTYFYVIKLYDKDKNITELKGSVNVAGK